MAARQGSSTGRNLRKAAKTVTRKSKRAVANAAKRVRAALGGNDAAPQRARKPRRRSAA